jgi:hypothetical protein
VLAVGAHEECTLDADDCERARCVRHDGDVV